RLLGEGVRPGRRRGDAVPPSRAAHRAARARVRDLRGLLPAGRARDVHEAAPRGRQRSGADGRAHARRARGVGRTRAAGGTHSVARRRLGTGQSTRAAEEPQRREGSLIAPGIFREYDIRGVVGNDLTVEAANARSEEHTSELQSLTNLVCRLLLEKKKNE